MGSSVEVMRSSLHFAIWRVARIKNIVLRAFGNTIVIINPLREVWLYFSCVSLHCSASQARWANRLAPSVELRHCCSSILADSDQNFFNLPSDSGFSDFVSLDFADFAC